MLALYNPQCVLSTHSADWNHHSFHCESSTLEHLNRITNARKLVISMQT